MNNNAIKESIIKKIERNNNNYNDDDLDLPEKEDEDSIKEEIEVN